MTEPHRPAYEYWFGLFSDDSDPRGRVLCLATALAFLGYPLSDLLSGRLSDGSTIVGAVGLATFAGLFLRLCWILPRVATDRRTEGFALLGAIAGLAVGLSAAFSDEWLGLMVYASVAMALALPVRLALPGVIGAAAIAAAIVGEPDSAAVQALSFGVLVLAVRRAMELVRELDDARGRVAELAVNEERLRLSRDMHDLLGHNLSLIALKSELARKLIGRDPEAAASEVHDIESVARTSLQEAREAVRGLRRASLAADLSSAREALETAGIEAHVHSEDGLPAEVEKLLGFAAREAVTNVIRHSGATRCEIDIRRVGTMVEIDVRDDGAGPSGAGEGSGLRGLAERMAVAGGTLEAGPGAAGGFRLTARLPISARPEPADSSKRLARTR